MKYWILLCFLFFHKAFYRGVIFIISLLLIKPEVAFPLCSAPDIPQRFPLMLALGKNNAAKFFQTFFVINIPQYTIGIG